MLSKLSESHMKDIEEQELAVKVRMELLKKELAEAKYEEDQIEEVEKQPVRNRKERKTCKCISSGS